MADVSTEAYFCGGFATLTDCASTTSGPVFETISFPDTDNKPFGWDACSTP